MGVRDLWHWAWNGPTLTAQAEPPPPSPVEVQLAAIRSARADAVVTNRDQAVRNSVVNRARDITCGVLAALELHRYAVGTGEDLGPGWLIRPDPDHTRAWFVAWVTDDLFFFGQAFARITAYNNDDQAIALQWMPWTQVLPTFDEQLPGRPITGATWFTNSRDITVAQRDLVIFDSPLTGLLRGGQDVLSTAARLDRSANRFANNEIAAGWLEQLPDTEDMSDKERTDLLELWSLARQDNAIGFTNRAVKWNESQMDPSRLQLVEGRAYQDANVARVCNMPNFVVGVGVPNDSMTYKTALTARLDVLDFALNPYIACWEQTLSDNKVTPRGTRVAFDPEPFIRTTQLAAAGPGVPGEQPAPAPTGGTPP